MSELEEIIKQFSKADIDIFVQEAKNHVEKDKKLLFNHFFKVKTNWDKVKTLIQRHENNRIELGLTVNDCKFKVIFICRDLPKEEEGKVA